MSSSLLVSKQSPGDLVARTEKDCCQIKPLRLWWRVEWQLEGLSLVAPCEPNWTCWPRRPKYLVVNADEGEPGTCKDRRSSATPPQAGGRLPSRGPGHGCSRCLHLHPRSFYNEAQLQVSRENRKELWVPHMPQSRQSSSLFSCGIYLESRWEGGDLLSWPVS